MDRKRMNGHREDEAHLYHVMRDEIEAEHFALREFQCSDGTPILALHPALLRGLSRLRSEFGVAVRVTSGFRTAAYNERIGGADESRHLYGLAADVAVQGVPPSDVAQWAERQEFGGVGRYDRFTHLDVWGKRRRWDRRG